VRASADRTLAAVVDAFAPGGDGLPSASELGVHRLLRSEVEALGRPSLVRQLDLLLRAMESRPANLALTGRPVRFSALTPRQREAYLRRLSTSPIPMKRTAFQDLKRLTFLLLYGLESSPYRARSGFDPTPSDPADVSPVRVRTPAAGEIVDADACVIGSGAGGGVVAAMLAAAGRRVVVLERARYVDETGFGRPELEGLASLFLDRGLAATEDRWISIRAGSAVGGGTVVNWSSSLRLPSLVRDEWATIGIGPELDDAYATVEREIHVVRDESDRNGPNAALERGLLALGLDATTIPRNVEGCGECGPCSVGCRRGAKRSALRTYLAEASRDGAEILDGTEARRVVVRAGAVTSVEATVPGGTMTIRAPLVALAGGAILSPAVLLRSGIATATAGRSLHLHPVTALVGFYDDPIRPWEGVPQSVMSESFAEVEGAYGFRLEAAPTHPGLIGSGYPWSEPAGHVAALGRAAHVAAFLAIVRDRGSGRVDLARDGAVRIHYGVGSDERRLLQRATVEVARVHRAAGAGRIVTLHTPALMLDAAQPFEPFAAAIARRGIAPNRILLFSAHQMSSCRMGTSSRDSVADPDGRVWGVRGLYVTDASAFPTASGVNPMLTVMALAHRTARRMLAA
jgi:choline dehydrogenase-like flavoprotein